MFDSGRNKLHQRVLCNEVRRIPSETIKQLALRTVNLVRKAKSLKTRDYKNTKKTRNFNNESNTLITEKGNKKESITSIFNSRTRYRLQKTIKKTRTSRNHYETGGNRKTKITISK